MEKMNDIQSEKILGEWQLCPKCNGNGIIFNPYMNVSSSPYVQCDVCCGAKILAKPVIGKYRIEYESA